MPTLRDIVSIDRDKCTGCGECVLVCAEAAIEIIDGKASLLRVDYCDGLGACLGHCPEDAIKIEKRESDPFDEQAVEQRLADLWTRGEHPMKPLAQAGDQPAAATCPSTRQRQLSPPSSSASQPQPTAAGLSHWPIKLRLVQPDAPFLEDADVMLVADCVAFASDGVPGSQTRDRAVLIGCPKFDEHEPALDRLTAILRTARIRSLTVVHMEVPCCSGYWHLAQQACAASGTDIRPQRQIVDLQGGASEPSG